MILVLLSTVVSACASGNFPTEIVNELNERWHITSLKVFEVDNGVRVTGRLNAPYHYPLPKGTILISVVSESDDLLFQKELQYHRMIKTSRWNHYDSQAAVFAHTFAEIPANSTIKARHIIYEK